MNPLWILLIAGILAVIFKSNLIASTGLNVAGLKSDFFEALGAEPTVYQDLTMRVASTKDQENYRWLGSVPQMREWLGDRVAHGLRTERYDVANKKYELTLEVDRDEISDDQTGQIRLRIQDLGGAAASYKDYLLSQLILNGGTAGFNSYDGVSFFNDAHVSGASGNQDNNLTFAAADGTTPTVQEFLDAYGQAIAQMMQFLDDQGRPITATALPSGLAVMVPPQLLKVAMVALQAQVIGQTTNVLMAPARIIPNAYLAGETAKFYLFNLGRRTRPFIFQDREPLEFAQLAEGSDDEFKREKYLFGVRARFNLAYGMWQYAVRTEFT